MRFARRALMWGLSFGIVLRYLFCAFARGELGSCALFRCRAERFQRVMCSFGLSDHVLFWSFGYLLGKFGRVEMLAVVLCFSARQSIIK